MGVERTCECPGGGADERAIAPFPREVRLGLVMYGGVSLAVYINGVAAEFFEAVQGSGIYGLLKCLRQSEIVVDIISGASAGGINGILLGHALTGKTRDLDASTALWREKGGVGELLQPAGNAAPPSLFDGDGYYTAELLRSLDCRDRRGAPGRPSCLPSPVEALDLFVTGTDYHGRRWSLRDGLGSAIEGKDHRGVFRLKYRRGVRDDFEDPPALAKLARITSSFPGAFAPVRVEVGDGPEASATDRRLAEWGRLQPGSSTHFIDGGVLDNKPFSQTIEQIYYRLAHQPVDRKVFFVEPDPELVAPVAAGPTGREEPDILGVLVKSLVTLPRYESIAGDLRDIDEYNRRVRTYRELLSALDGDGQAAASAIEPSEVQRRWYASCRWQWLEERIGEAVQSVAGPVSGAALGATRAADLGRVLDGDLDVEHSLRRLFHVTYRLYDDLYAGSRGEVASAEASRVLLALNRHIQLLKIVEWAVERAIELGASHWVGAGAALPTRVRAMLRHVLEADDVMWQALSAEEMSPEQPDRYLPDAALQTAVRDRLAARLEDLADRPAHALGLDSARKRPTLLDLERTLTRRVLDGSSDPRVVRAASASDAFADLDVHLYPLEVAAGIREKDEIETIRISASDAQLGFSGRPGGDKVSGDALGHFGGFFKRSWRANDILWGRLDARCQLIRALLQADQLEARLTDPGARRKVRAHVASFLAAAVRADARDRPPRTSGCPCAAAARDLPLAALFPAAADADLDELTCWLHRLLDDDPAHHEAALARLRHKDSELLDLVVRVAQSDIVRAGVADVVEDASAEARTWAAPAFASPSDLDAAELARSPDAFARRYKVGEERLMQNIPPRILLGLFARGSLILRDAVFGAADQRANRNRGGRLLVRPLRVTRRVLGWPLHVACWYATVTRARSVRLGLGLVAAILFGVFLWLGRSAIGTTDPVDGWRLSWLKLGVFVGLPALIVAAEISLRQLGPPLTRRRAVRLALTVMTAALAGVVCLGVQAGHYDGLLGWLGSLEPRQLAVYLGSPLVGLLIMSRFLTASATATGKATARSKSKSKSKSGPASKPGPAPGEVATRADGLVTTVSIAPKAVPH